MKIKLLATAIGAALCSAGTLYAATAANDKNSLHAPNFTQQELAAYQKRVAASRNVMQDDGLNVKVNTQTPKFIDEPELSGEQTYIVRLNSAPVAMKRANLLAQQPAQGISRTQAKQLSTGNRQQLASYRQQLEQQQQAVISQVRSVAGSANIRKQFSEALNGFSVNMTPDEAKRVAQMGEVAFVHRAKVRQLQSDAGADLIEADKVWQGATETGVTAQGEGVVIGVLDTGINTDPPSFAVTGDDGYTVQNPLGSGVFLGDCKVDATLCNDKLIGVYHYDVITNEYWAMDESIAFNGEDYNGHGSHTASTAGGNILHDVALETYSTQDNGTGTILKEALFPEVSGIAPHANVISYQVCWPTSDSGLAGCPDEAILQGIEDAIADEVDVLNYSIGGSDALIYEDAIQMAFLAAHESGIAVAAAAGNSGQQCGSECFYSLDNASPWLMNVAASTLARKTIFESRLESPTFATPSDGSTMPEFDFLAGGAVNENPLTGVIVEARDYDNVNGEKDQYCGSAYADGTFDVYPNGDPIVDETGAQLDTIVVCARNDLQDPNGVARTDKSDNIKAGGAEGFIMWNYGIADPVVYTAKYSLPAVHLSYEDWWGGQSNGFVGLIDWIRNGERGHTMTITETVIENQTNPDDADWLAPFSSRGPSYYNPGVLVPMVAAPGVDVYAAYADQHPFVATPGNADFAFVSGTSMASPHVAGAMALLTQLHPQWSPSEIQSALMMTADETVRYYHLNQPNGEVHETGTYRSGSGRINVANAADAGLVMHESADNFLQANPNNGGSVEKLNLPYLTDMTCQPECTWTRTVKATTDGNWRASHGPVTNWNVDTSRITEQKGVEISISPAEFSLLAGEEQLITVTAKIQATQDVQSNSEVELHSQLRLEEVNDNAGDIHMPMAFKYDHGKLPYSLTVTTHADEGQALFENINVEDAQAPFARVYQPVKADVYSATLPKDDEYIYPWEPQMDMNDPKNSREARLDDSVKTHWFDIPADTSRVIVEMLKVTDSPFINFLDKVNPIVYLGQDLNNDGEIQIADELICMSNHVVTENFCNLSNPKEGKYWALFYSYITEADYPRIDETFDYGVTVIPKQVADNMSVSVDNTIPSDSTLSLDYQLADMAEGEVYYTTIDVGTSETNPGNLGEVPLKVIRGEDTVSMQVGESNLAEKTAALPGEKVPYTFKVLANTSGLDREFTFTTEIPEGMSLSTEDVLLSNANAAEVTIEDGVLTISGVQENTRDVEPSYITTTNLTDEMCYAPSLGNSNPGGYIDLAEFNISPSFGSFEEDGRLEYHRGVTVPLYSIFGANYDNWHLFNNQEGSNVHMNALGIRGNGMIDLWGGTRAELENIMTMFRTYPEIQQETHLAVELSGNSGISLAATQNGWGVIEWDNAKSYQNVGNFRVPNWQPTLDDNYNFELIFNTETRFGDNEHELYMAYDSLDFGASGEDGLVGFLGFKGYVQTYGPLNGFLENWFTRDNLTDSLSDGLVVCYDYVGPESSQFEVTAWPKVAANSYGKTFAWNTEVTLAGQATKAISHSLSVNGNITMPAIADMTTPESTPVSFEVHYTDGLANTANQIMVSGDNFTATVEGDTVTITPDEYFFGETEVTVTVADIENSSDQASSNFMLMVESDGEDKPTTVQPTAPETDSGSSGSVAWISLLLASLVSIRRRKLKK